MIHAILEIVLAVLAAVGLSALLWLILGRKLLAPSGEMLTVVWAKGDGAQLEQDVRGLLWLKDCGLWQGKLIAADLGLDENGRRLARLLCANSDDIIFCLPEELPRLVPHH